MYACICLSVYLSIYLYLSIYPSIHPSVWLSPSIHPTHTLIPWSRVLLEKLIVSQLLKNFPALNVTRALVTAFTKARDLLFSYARSIQSVPVIPLDPCQYLSFYAQVFQVSSFPQVSPPKHCLHLSSPRYMPRAPPVSDSSCFVTRLTFGEAY